MLGLLSLYPIKLLQRCCQHTPRYMMQVSSQKKKRIQSQNGYVDIYLPTSSGNAIPSNSVESRRRQSEKKRKTQDVLANL